jgi:hypothetical protein
MQAASPHNPPISLAIAGTPDRCIAQLPRIHEHIAT